MATPKLDLSRQALALKVMHHHLRYTGLPTTCSAFWIPEADIKTLATECEITHWGKDVAEDPWKADGSTLLGYPVRVITEGKTVLETKVPYHTVHLTEAERDKLLQLVNLHEQENCLKDVTGRVRYVSRSLQDKLHKDPE